MFHNNFGKCWPIFNIVLPDASQRFSPRLQYVATLGDLVKFDNPKTLPNFHVERNKQVYRIRYEIRRSSKPDKKQNKIKYGEKRFLIWRMQLLNPAMWHDHDIDFARWLHPAMWHVALESWQWNHQVATPCNVIRGSGMTCHWICQTSVILEFYIWFRFRPYHRSRRYSAPVWKILSKSDQPQPKKMTSCRFSSWRISAILDFRSPIMGSLKSPCTTFYRSLIDTIALNCLGF